jgi:hypothetical protein
VFSSGSGDAVSLYNTAGNWDTIDGSNVSGRAEPPQKWRRKIPQSGGLALAISSRGDQRLHFSVAGRGVSGSADGIGRRRRLCVWAKAMTCFPTTRLYEKWQDGASG